MVVPPCPWKLARSAYGTLTKESFFSDNDALLFQLGDLSTDPRCPGLQFQPTGFPELVLTMDKTHLPSLTGGTCISTYSSASTPNTCRINSTASQSMGSQPTTRLIVTAKQPVYALAS